MEASPRPYTLVTPRKVIRFPLRPVAGPDLRVGFHFSPVRMSTTTGVPGCKVAGGDLGQAPAGRAGRDRNGDGPTVLENPDPLLPLAGASVVALLRRTGRPREAARRAGRVEDFVFLLTRAG